VRDYFSFEDRFFCLFVLFVCSFVCFSTTPPVPIADGIIAFFSRRVVSKVHAVLLFSFFFCLAWSNKVIEKMGKG